MVDEIMTTNTPTKPRQSGTRARSMMGNTNASRNPWTTFWRRRALRPEHR